MVPENVRQDQAKSEQTPGKAKLVEEYREVGPAAINAALQCKPKKKEAPKRSYEPHEEI